MRGAYSLVFLTEDQLIAARDPDGFRPLVLGRVERRAGSSRRRPARSTWSTPRYEREIEPGEIVVIDARGLESLRPFPPAHAAHCVFEYVYFARPDSQVFGRNVYEVRKELGRQLARESGVPADIVIPVPDSGVPAALGYAEEAGLPFEMGLIRNHYVGRTFIEPQQLDPPLRREGEAERAARGAGRASASSSSTTRSCAARRAGRSCTMIRQAGAREVHMRISSPPTTNPCYYGIDTPTREELIASSHSVEEIREYLGADSLAYLSEAGHVRLHAAVGATGFCDACFTGRYPIPLERGCADAASSTCSRRASGPRTADRRRVRPARRARDGPRVLPRRRATRWDTAARVRPSRALRGPRCRAPRRGPSGVVDRVVQAAALFAGAGARDDELGDGGDVAELDQVAR